MTGAVLAAGDLRVLGATGARITFAADPSGPDDRPGRRVLAVDGEPAFELSSWCGTCPVLFRRQQGATQTLAQAALTDRLTAGLDALDDDVLDTVGSLLPPGSYLPLLLTVTPRLTRPVEDGDYFAGEQVATWGIDAFWGLPENPRTPYYRTFETAVDDAAHLYEFVVPMVPPSWDDPATVAAHAGRLATSDRPTAVAVATLDVMRPAMDHGEDPYAHWGLTHFLLDGHHKVHAAAETGRALRLLSLVSVGDSLADPAQLAALPRLRAAAPGRRR